MIHFITITRALAFLSLIICVFMLPCGVLALVDHDLHAATVFFAIIPALAVPAALLIRLLFNARRGELSARDGFLLVFVAWVGIAFFASLPFYFSNAVPTVADAFFEAASGVSTTGATVIDDIEALPRAIILWRAICHWMGGMGIIMLTVALLPLLGIGGLQLLKAEQHGVDSEKLTSRAAQTAKYLWIIYTAFTVICLIFYKIGGMSTFDAVCHAFSAIATGGFSSMNSSMESFSPFIQWTTIAAMFLGGCSFILYYRFFTGKFLKIFKNTELRVYIGIILATTAIVALSNIRHDVFTNLEETIRHSTFQVVSLITTTGFATADYTMWPALSQFALFLLLFIGGCSGSTAGGIKVVRIVLIFKQATIELKHLIHPRGVFTLRLNGNTVSKDIVYSVIGFFILYLFTVMLVAAVASFAGASLETAFSTGLAMVGNTGLGMSGIGPTDTYSFYPEFVKWVLGFAMLIGRLELYTFFILLTPFFWKR